MPDSPPVAAPLRVVWLTVCAGAALAMGVLGALAVRASRAPAHEYAEGAFYTVALLSVIALGGALALVRQMERRLARAESDRQAERTVLGFGAAALAAAGVPSVASALAAFVTGDLLVLALGAPLFAFAWLTWPSDGRVAYWLALRR